MARWPGRTHRPRCGAWQPAGCAAAGQQGRSQRQQQRGGQRGRQAGVLPLQEPHVHGFELAAGQHAHIGDRLALHVHRPFDPGPAGGKRRPADSLAGQVDHLDALRQAVRRAARPIARRRPVERRRPGPARGDLLARRSRARRRHAFELQEFVHQLAHRQVRAGAARVPVDALGHHLREALQLQRVAAAQVVGEAGPQVPAHHGGDGQRRQAGDRREQQGELVDDPQAHGGHRKPCWRAGPADGPG